MMPRWIKHGDVALILFKVGLRKELAQPSLLLSQVLFLCVILYVFSHLWQAAFESGFSTTAVPADFVWYLLLTELVVLSAPQVFRPIQEEIRSGDIVQRLLKPVPYPIFPIAQGMGTVCIRLLVIGPVGLLFTGLLTGGLPPSTMGLLAGLVLVPIAALTLLVFLTTIGLMAGWIFDAAPIYWVFTKILFILGGLMLPLTIYPTWLQDLAMLTPFYAMLYGVGRHVLLFSVDSLIASAVLLCLWLALAIIFTQFLYSRLTRIMTVGGG